MIEFYHKWLVYGGLFAVFGTMLTIYIYGKIKGADKTTWKVVFPVAIIFMAPTIFLPLFLAPGHLLEKIILTVVIAVSGVLKYYLQTKAQENIEEWRERKKNHKDENG